VRNSKRPAKDVLEPLPDADVQARPGIPARPQTNTDAEPRHDAERAAIGVPRGGTDEPRTDAEPRPAAEPEDEAIPPSLSVAASAAGSAIASAASSAGEQVLTAVRGAGELAQLARHALAERAGQLAVALAERPGARVRRVRRMAKEPLPVLWDVHPEARNAPMRELGIVEVPVERILGTAQEVGDRGGDFLPLKAFRGDNWRARWQRILAAVDDMKHLPPVDLIRTGDEYWVVDGHNRVAAALYNGQLSLDANVMDLRLPGTPRTPGPPAPIAPYFAEDMLELRAAGEGHPVRGDAATHAILPVGDDHAHPPDQTGDGESTGR
jgi:hypothetical protein